MPLLPGKPESPGKPKVVFFTIDSIWIEWSKPSNVKQSITGYCVQYRLADVQTDTEWIETNVLGRSTETKIKSLKAGGTYDFRVASYSIRGRGPPSDVLRFTLNEPTFPQNLKGHNVALDSATLKWDRPPYKGFDPGTDGHYILESRDSGQSRSIAWIQHAEISSSAESHQITGLNPGTRYTFRVRIEYSRTHEDKFKLGRRSPADVLPSDQIECFTSVKPAKPTSPKVQIIKNLQLVWDPPTDTGGSELIGYYVERKKDGRDEWLRFANNLTPQPNYRVLHTNLKDGKYMFRVVAVNAGGLHSEPSDPSDIYTNKVVVQALAAAKAIDENQTKNTPAHRRLQSEGYRNYLKALLFIQIFCKEALTFCDKTVKELHRTLTTDPNLLQGKHCLNHNRECNPLKDKTGRTSACTNCKAWVTELKNKAVGQELSRGKIQFRDISSKPWEMAKLFMIRQLNTTQNKSLGQDFDSASLLHLMKSCKCFHGNKPGKKEPEEYKTVVDSRNKLMHLEIKKGLQILKKQMKGYFKVVVDLIFFIQKNVEPDATMFPADKMLEKLQNVKDASIDSLVEAEDDVIGEIVEEYETEKSSLEEEMKEQRHIDPDKVKELEDKIKELSSFLQQNEDLSEKFGDRVKNLNVDEINKFLADQSARTTEEDGTQKNEDASQDLLQFQNELASFYSLSFSHVELQPLEIEETVPITDLKTDLYLLSDENQDNHGKSLSYEELLSFKIDDSPVKKFLIFGKEGIGKSTYMKRIAYDWAAIQQSKSTTSKETTNLRHSAIGNYQLVIALDARLIDNSDDLATTIMKQLISSKSSIMREFLETYIRANPDKVLVIVDGFSGRHSSILETLKECTTIITLRPKHQKALGDLRKDYVSFEITRGSTSEDTQDVLKDEMRNVQHELALSYNLSFGHVELLPNKLEKSIPITDLCTDLDLLPDEKRADKVKLSSYEDLLNLQIDGSSVTRFLIYGQEGIGKSTYVRRIAYDWAAVQLSESTVAEEMATPKRTTISNYHLVVILDARRINDSDNLSTTIIKQLLPVESTDRQEVLETYIREHPEKVLVMVDGFVGGISGILQDTALKQCKMILTLRPEHQTSLGDLRKDGVSVEITRSTTSEDTNNADEIKMKIIIVLCFQLQNELALHYGLSFSHVELLPREHEKSIPITDLRTDLDLLPDEKRADNEKLPSYEELLNLKIDGTQVRRILILGKEGIGKSTYAKRIAFDWATLQLSESTAVEETATPKRNPISNYQLVVDLDARRIDNSDDITTSIIKQLLPSKWRASLETYIRGHPEKVLIILDGFTGGINKILGDTALKECMIILTSRPQHQTTLGELRQDFVPVEITRLAGLEDTRDAGEDEVRIQQLPEQLQRTAIAFRNICYNFQSIPHERLQEQAEKVLAEIKKLKLEELKLVMTGTTSVETVTEDLYSMKHLHIGNFHTSIASIIREKSGRVSSQKAKGVKK